MPKKNELGYTLKDYRRAISTAWLPVVGRKRLSSFEYKLTEEWFDESKPLSWVLQAINNCSTRARAGGKTLYSIGVIRSDLHAVSIEKARMMVGAGPEVRGQRFSEPETTDQKPETDSVDDWREEWRQIILQAYRDTSSDLLKAQYVELINNLQRMNREQVARAVAQIAKGLKWD